MSIQRLYYLGGGGGGFNTEALPGVGVQGKKSIHLRVTEEQRAQLILRGRGTLGNRENMGNKGTGTIFSHWEGLIRDYSQNVPKSKRPLVKTSPNWSKRPQKLVKTSPWK